MKIKYNSLAGGLVGPNCCFIFDRPLTVGGNGCFECKYNQSINIAKKYVKCNFYKPAKTKKQKEIKLKNFDFYNDNFIERMADKWFDPEYPRYNFNYNFEIFLKFNKTFDL